MAVKTLKEAQENIKSRLNVLGYTSLIDLANKTEVTYNSIYNLYMGKNLHVRNLILISTALKVSMDEIVWEGLE